MGRERSAALRRARSAALHLAAAAVALAAFAAPTASAAADAELSMMDDQALLGTPSPAVDSTLGQMEGLGADRVRISAFWSDIAPAATSTAKPAGFKAANPDDPSYNWTALDTAVRLAFDRHLKVLISISTPMPYWASSQPARRNSVWEPKPVEFAQFAHAVALRYRDLADQFALLNEPNQGAWLQPQSVAGQVVAPHLYRALVEAGYPAVKAADPSATVLIGELASSGRDDRGTTRPIRPLAFLRAMGCRDAGFRAVRRGRCKRFRPVPLDALGHHPYSLFLSPFQRSPDRDDAAMGDWRRLEQTLDRLVAVKALKPSRSRRFPIYYTEFGYQTDPPDPYAGIPLGRQSRWLQDAAYVAWRTPRVNGLNQFRLTDGTIRGKAPLAYREFQSGLRFANGKPKPSLAGFPNPIVVRPSGRNRLLVWGQARPGGGRALITIERRAPASKRFRQIASLKTDIHGYFQRRFPRRAGAYRYAWRLDNLVGGTSTVVAIGR
jgi:hypothetical protein